MTYGSKSFNFYSISIIYAHPKCENAGIKVFTETKYSVSKVTFTEGKTGTNFYSGKLFQI